NRVARGPRPRAAAASLAGATPLEASPVAARSAARPTARRIKSMQKQDGRSTGPRSLQQALLRGAMLKCPACGVGGLFHRYLKVVDQCPQCGESLHHHRADDAPAYFTIVIVGHVVVSLVLAVEIA